VKGKEIGYRGKGKEGSRIGCSMFPSQGTTKSWTCVTFATELVIVIPETLVLC
jgi:hypothetical protein